MLYQYSAKSENSIYENLGDRSVRLLQLLSLVGSRKDSEILEFSESSSIWAAVGFLCCLCLCCAFIVVVLSIGITSAATILGAMGSRNIESGPLLF